MQPFKWRHASLFEWSQLQRTQDSTNASNVYKNMESQQ
jgi:hypothetical protein